MKKYSLSKTERIKLKSDFKLVYNNGKTIFSKSSKLKATFYIEENTERCGVQAAFAVHRKAGNAVWRNRAKRILRESYRTNKEILAPLLVGKNILLLVVFSTSSVNQRKNKNISLNDFVNDVVELMQKIRDSIKNA